MTQPLIDHLFVEPPEYWSVVDQCAHVTVTKPELGITVRDPCLQSREKHVTGVTQ